MRKFPDGQQYYFLRDTEKCRLIYGLITKEKKIKKKLNAKIEYSFLAILNFF